MCHIHFRPAWETYGAPTEPLAVFGRSLGAGLNRKTRHSLIFVVIPKLVVLGQTVGALWPHLLGMGA